MHRQAPEVDVYLFPHEGKGVFLSRIGKCFLAAVLGVGIAVAGPSKPPVPEDEMVSRYIDATQQQQSALRGGTMEVDIDAKVPKMKTKDKLHALKSISKLGKIT